MEKPFSHKLQDKKNEFKRLFDLPAVDFIDTFMTVATKKYSVDIVKLDEWMERNKGYDMDKDGSLNDFIRKTYGDEAVNFLKENM